MRWLMLTLAVAPLLMAQNSNRPDDRNRGQETTNRHSLGDRGAGAGQWKGVLVDAGCRDRAAAVRSVRDLFAKAGQDTGNVRTSDRPRAASKPAQNADALEHHTPEHAARQPGGGPCAVTAETTAFALLTSKGEWLDLSPSSDLKAIEALRSSPKGRDLLSGKLTSGQYFHVTLNGHATDTRRRIEVDSLRVE